MSGNYSFGRPEQARLLLACGLDSESYEQILTKEIESGGVYRLLVLTFRHLSDLFG